MRAVWAPESAGTERRRISGRSAGMHDPGDTFAMGAGAELDRSACGTIYKEIGNARHFGGLAAGASHDGQQRATGSMSYFRVCR